VKIRETAVRKFPSWTSRVRFRSPAPTTTRGCRPTAAPRSCRCCLVLAFTRKFVRVVWAARV